MHAQQVAKGDFIMGEGFVTAVRRYSRDVADKRSVNRPIKKKLSSLAQARVIAREIEETYAAEVDSIVVEIGNRRLTYSPRQEVATIRTRRLTYIPKAA